MTLFQLLVCYIILFTSEAGTQLGGGFVILMAHKMLLLQELNKFKQNPDMSLT